jgi:hypothetical protein
MNVVSLAQQHPPVSVDSLNSLKRQSVATRAKIPRDRSIAQLGSSSEANGLQRRRRKAPCVRSDRSRKGWSCERRARQAALIRTWAPWRRSTGPKTEAGKARCSMNALKHGHRSRATIREYQRIHHVLRLTARNIAVLRAHIRARDQAARPQIRFKPWYVRMLASAKPACPPKLEERRRNCPSHPPGAIALG